MIKAIIQSIFIGTGQKGDAIRPKFADDFNVNWSDNGDGTITAIVDEETLDSIKSNQNYDVVSQEVIPLDSE